MMNLISFLLLGIVLALVLTIAYRAWRKHKRRRGNCATCDVDGCALRDLLAKSSNPKIRNRVQAQDKNHASLTE